jgi:hypothetical protein
LKKRLPRATLILNIEIDIYINTNNIQTNTGDGLVIFFKYNKLKKNEKKSDHNSNISAAMYKHIKTAS